jgi:phage N-6-adenine-methyltransferase
MSSVAPFAYVQPADIALARYVEIDARVDGAEKDGIMARWEFGRALLAEREANGGKQLPHGRLDEVAEAIGKSQTEIKYRMLFATKYTDPAEVVTAVTTFQSWTAIRDSFSSGDGEEVHNHRAQGTGENEWYTPAMYLDAARDVMGGIDLDPASSVTAQERVKADKFFTAADNGLVQEWHGRVWLNPPYSQPLIEDFIRKLLEEVDAGRVSSAITLTHNYTDTTWFHLLAGRAAAISFTKGRIKFTDSAGGTCAPTQGQAFCYFGDDVERFADAFGSFGFVVMPAW